MDNLFDIIGDFMADSITEIFTDSDYMFACSLFFFAICIIGEAMLAYLNKKDIINPRKGIFLGFLLLNITVSLTATILCKLWFAIIISAIATILIPVFEKRKLCEYLNCKFTLSFKKYLIYAIASLLSIFSGIMIIKTLL